MSELEEGTASNFDLLRGFIAEEYPDRLSLFDQCTHRFRRVDPGDDIFQYFIATGFLTLVFRSVPEKLAKILAEAKGTAASSPEDATRTLTPVVDLIRGDLAGIKQDVLTQITEALALYRVDMAKGQPAPSTRATARAEETTPADAAPTAPPRPSGRKFAPWIFAGLLALAAGGVGGYFGDRHARLAADLQMESRVQARMSQVKTWLDTEQEAKAVLMSRKATLSFDFARDPSLKDHKVYTLTVKGVPIVRAGKTKEGDGVIAWESNVPDLFTQ